MHILANNGVVVGVAVNITATTYDKIFDIVSNFNRNISGLLSHVIVQRIIPSGNASDGDDHILNRDQVNTAMEQVNRVHDELGITISTEDPFPLCTVDERHHKYMHRCEWGISKFSINADGNFSRCGAAPTQSLGNILYDDFSELWNTAAQLKAFRNLNYLSEKCRSCHNRLICGGGCPISNQINTLGEDYLINEGI